MASTSKFPDMKEIGAIACKLYKDISNSIKEVIQDYKENHKQESSASEINPTTESSTTNVIKETTKPKKTATSEEKSATSEEKK